MRPKSPLPIIMIAHLPDLLPSLVWKDAHGRPGSARRGGKAVTDWPGLDLQDRVITKEVPVIQVPLSASHASSVSVSVRIS